MSINIKINSLGDRLQTTTGALLKYSGFLEYLSGSLRISSPNNSLITNIYLNNTSFTAENLNNTTLEVDE